MLPLITIHHHIISKIYLHHISFKLLDLKSSRGKLGWGVLRDMAKKRKKKKKRSRQILRGGRLKAHPYPCRGGNGQRLAEPRDLAPPPKKKKKKDPDKSLVAAH